MKRFRQLVIDHGLEESFVRKGAVATYAAQSRRYGDVAATSYGRARFELQRSLDTETADQKLDHLTAALLHVVDGLIATRQQIGAVSAQITSNAMLTGSTH